MSHTAGASAVAAAAAEVCPAPTEKERQNLHRLLALSESLPYTQHRLNEGAFCSPLVLEVLDRYKSAADFRTYSTIDNRALREELARLHKTKPDSVFVSNGSGIILKLGMKALINDAILHPNNFFVMVHRAVKHALQLEAFPVVTTSLTYSKVPRGAFRNKLPIRFIPLEPETNFELDLEALKEAIADTPSLVYIANPNNPTGNVLIKPESFIPIVKEHPDHFFWVDEAYFEFLDSDKYESFTNYVPELPNLVVSHSFSFAHGIAAAHVGYLIGSPRIVKILHDSVTMYGVSKMAEEIALAALCGAPTHLPFVRKYMAKECDMLMDACRAVGFLEPFPTHTNFFLVKISDSVHFTAYDVQKFMTARGCPIRTFDNYRPFNFDKLFRITIGLPSDNLKLAQGIRSLPQPPPALAPSKL